MVERIKKDREGPPRIYESIKRTKGRGTQRGYEERKEENSSSGGGSGGGKKRVPLRLSK